jgi:hypothetical protein
MIGAMEGMEFEGPKGTINIRPEDHVAIQDMYIATLTNVDDPEAKFFEYVSTNRPNVPCLLPEGLQDRCGDLPDRCVRRHFERMPPSLPNRRSRGGRRNGLSVRRTGQSRPHHRRNRRACDLRGTHAPLLPLGMEYATGSEGVEGDGYTSYMVDECEIEVYVRDDQSNPEITATVGRELIEVVGVDILVGTVSSGATATLQELARDNQVIH